MVTFIHKLYDGHENNSLVS